MSNIPWLSANECRLLRPDADADPSALRRVQQLLGFLSIVTGTDDVARALLEAISSTLQADFAAIVAAPQWQAVWQHIRPGAEPRGHCR